MTIKKNRSKQSALPHVGDVVRFTFVFDEEIGQVVEYRGAIGVNGEHIFGVRFPLTPAYEEEEQYTELPAERLQVIKQAA